MGAVYRGVDRETGGQVAIKVLTRTSGADVQRFEREVKLLKKLAHPRIVCYVDAGVTASGARYLVQEWVEGVRLRDYMERIGLTPAEAVVIVRNLAEPLAVAHAAGVVHRDVKPSNAILEYGELERVRLLDFGVARELAEVSSLTRTGTMVGTPSYMAPEQARGAPEIDARADVFALGCLLYEGLTGTRAFPGANMIAVRAKVLMCRPASLEKRCPEAPPALSALVAEMLAKEPEARPRDASCVLSRLDELPALPDEPHRPVDRGTPPRFPAGYGEATTEETEQLTCVVFAASTPHGEHDGAEGSDDGAVTQLDPRVEVPGIAGLRAALAPLDATLEMLDDGALVLTLASHGDPCECAGRAAQAAMLLRDHLPEAAVAVGGYAPRSDPESGRSLEEAIDWGARTVELAALQSLFAEYRPDAAPGVHLDEAVAALLPDGFHVESSTSGWVLATGGDASPRGDATIVTE